MWIQQKTDSVWQGWGLKETSTSTQTETQGPLLSMGAFSGEGEECDDAKPKRRGEHKGLFVKFPRDSCLRPFVVAECSPRPANEACQTPAHKYFMHHFTAQTLLSSAFVPYQFLSTVSLRTPPGEPITSPMRLLSQKAALPFPVSPVNFKLGLWTISINV